MVSISSSGRPYRTPKGHSPEWTLNERMSWHAADALDPPSYRDLIKPCTAVVHTVGILLEGKYKGADGSVAGALQGLLRGWGIGGARNPLQSDADADNPLTYERMNRDTAIAVAQTFAEEQQSETQAQKPFVFLSAADILRPIVSARYCSNKREAETVIDRIAHQNGHIRPVFLRPGACATFAEY